MVSVLNKNKTPQLMLRTNLIAALSFCIFNFISAQQRPLIEYDVLSKTYDTLSVIEFDTSEVAAQTDFFIGNFDENIADLEQTTPTENIFENSSFTKKQLARDFYNLTDYPIRTSVKLFHIENDTLKDWCSGSMVSNQHVLTATHCFIDLMTDEIMDSILVCPVYDDGLPNGNFECVDVNQYYFFEDWSPSGTDMGLLKLSQPIGLETGWISIGYDEKLEESQDEIFYKFSYPSKSILAIDSMEYDGHDLYFNYGSSIKILGDNLFGINGSVNSIPGESGSSLIKVQNDVVYTTYGTHVFSSMIHNKITDWKYYAFASILQDNLTSTTSTIESEGIVLYPNPATDRIFLKNIDEKEIEQISIYDAMGRFIKYIDGDLEVGMDISALSDGTYFLKVQQKNTLKTLRFIKIK